MDTFLEMITAVQSDLTINDDSSFLDLTTVKLAINRAYRKIAGLYRWPDLEDAKKTSTVDGQEYYDYPDNWRPDSVWRVEVDDEQYGEEPDGSPLSFEDYLIWRRDENNANSTEKKWGSQWRRFFIYPVPDDDGSNNITVWGHKVAEALSDDANQTIFSQSMPELNEAIVMEAVAILKAKGEVSDSAQQPMVSPGALGIVTVAWNKIRQDNAKYEKNQPFFNIPDFFARKRNTRSTNRGNFD